jgi:mono/diheme cytochrome c family protein
MPDYAAQISPADRWAIAAYIRVLQLSQNATQADVPAGAHVQTIAAVEEESGFSESFLSDWLGKTAQHVHPETPTAAPAAATPVSAPSSSAVPAPTSPNAKVDPAKPTQVAALGGAPSPSPAAQAAEAPKAAAAAPAAAGNATHGKELYANNCSVCHQPNRAGMAPVFPSLVGVVERVGEKRVRTVAKDGIPEAKPPMPPHPNLADKDLDDLLAFLKTKP